MHCRRQALLRCCGIIRVTTTSFFFLKDIFRFYPFCIIIASYHSALPWSFLSSFASACEPILRALKIVTVLVIWFTGCANKLPDLGRDFQVLNGCKSRQKEKRNSSNWFYFLPKKMWWNDVRKLPMAALNSEHWQIKPLLRILKVSYMSCKTFQTYYYLLEASLPWADLSLLLATFNTAFMVFSIAKNNTQKLINKIESTISLFLLRDQYM